MSLRMLSLAHLMLVEIDAICDVGRLTGTHFTAHREMRGFQIGNHCTDFGCRIAGVLVRDGAERPCWDHFLEGAIGTVDEVSCVVRIAHGQSDYGIFVIAAHGHVGVNIGGAEGEGAFSHHEVALGELHTLLCDHLFVDVGGAEGLVDKA